MSTVTFYERMPDLIDAFHEALSCHSHPDRHRWSHPVVHEAARLTGFFILKEYPVQQSLELFGKHYQDLRNQWPEEAEKKNTSPMFQIQELANYWDLDPALLYYLTKPKGSQIRTMMRERCLSQLKPLQKDISLPL